MHAELYDMIFKRKSFHTFKPVGKFSENERNNIERVISAAAPLFPDIRTEMILVPSTEVSGARGAEYCILFYSEKKDGWLQNVGYIGEQIDLELTAQNIGTLWLGLGKTSEKKHDGLDFVIMMAIAKADPSQFRKDVTKASRKSSEQLWSGKELPLIKTVLYAPSACNGQPWRIKNTGTMLSVYRSTHRAGLIPAAMLGRLNRIDMGIFLCFMDLCLEHDGIKCERTVYKESDEPQNDVLNAEYRFA